MTGWAGGVVTAIDTAEIGLAAVVGFSVWAAARGLADLSVYWPYRRRVRRRAEELLALFEEARSRSRRVPPKLREQVLARDGAKCSYCEAVEDLHLDHIRPHSRGGLTVLENLQVLCGVCNIRKGVLPDEEARRLILGQAFVEGDGAA